jgi:hypothetical protein
MLHGPGKIRDQRSEESVAGRWELIPLCQCHDFLVLFTVPDNKPGNDTR